MKESSHCRFNLKQSEIDYLVLIKAPLRNAFVNAQKIESDVNFSHSIELSMDDAEQLRDFLTERLAATGFDAEYNPTAEGVLIEDLIDRFYVR